MSSQVPHRSITHELLCRELNHHHLHRTVNPDSTSTSATHGTPSTPQQGSDNPVTRCPSSFTTAQSPRVRYHYTPEILNPRYRFLVRRAYKRVAATNPPRKVFKTASTGAGMTYVNPVYDIQYSPVVGRNYRVVALGDEAGSLSVIRVGFNGRAGSRAMSRMRKAGRQLHNVLVPPETDQLQQQVSNLGAVSVSSSQGHAAAAATAAGGGSYGYEDEHDREDVIQPVLYSLAWNPTGDRVVAGYGDGSIRVWDVGKGDSLPPLVGYFQAYDKSIKRVGWRGAEVLVSCSRTNEISVHDSRMRNPLANRINCTSLNSRLTDISMLDDNYVLSCSSNSSLVHLWDLRNTYHLYKRVKPVQSFDLGSHGFANMKRDEVADDPVVYALGADSVVRAFDWRGGGSSDGTVETTSYRVPGPVDFFTKIDVDAFAGVMVAGGSGGEAYGFDVAEAKGGSSLVTGECNERSTTHRNPFFRLSTEDPHQQAQGRGGCEDDEQEYDDDDFMNVDKENRVGQVVENGLVGSRSCSAVALGTRRGVDDCAIQIATGGDDSTLTVWD